MPDKTDNLGQPITEGGAFPSPEQPAPEGVTPELDLDEAVELEDADLIDEGDDGIENDE